MRQLLTIALAFAATGCSSPSQQIECPVAETGHIVRLLQETPAQVKAASDGLGRGDENQIAGLASRIRARHPGATKLQIVDYLVAVYCPKINASGTADKTTKQLAVKDFASRAERIVGLTSRTP
jgi:hypothetical protein